MSADLEDVRDDIEDVEQPGTWTPEVVGMLEDALGRRRAAGLMSAAEAGRKAEAARRRHAREPWWRRPIHHDPDPVPPRIAGLLLRLADGDLLDREDEQAVDDALGRGTARTVRRSR